MSISKFVDRKDGTDIFEETHNGLVVETYIKNYWDDWDYMAVVYNPKTNDFEHIMTGTTRGYCPGSATVDADDNLLKKYQDHINQIERQRMENDRKENPGKYARPDMMAEVVKGRKIKIGTVGRIFWVGDTRYGRSVGIEVEGNKMFTSAKNIRLL